MTPEGLRYVRSCLQPNTSYHVRTVSGDLHSGKIKPANRQDILELENMGPVTSDLGNHTVWIAAAAIESIEEQS